MARKASRNTAATAKSATIWPLPQPASPPRMMAKTKAPSATLKVRTPPQSVRWARLLKDSRTRREATSRLISPTGTLMKKIHRQDSALVSAPPISGPVAMARPAVAPNALKAVARSLPWNSWPSSAGPTANMIAAPMPWTPRSMLSVVVPPARPQASEAAVNSANPAWKTRLRPIRSANEPAVTRNTASVNA